MGPTGRRKNLRTKRRGGRLHDHRRADGSGWRRACGTVVEEVAEGQIVLVGHSWGSTLGVFMAKARPELFYAFVGTGQVVDPARNYAVAYAALLEKASREGNSRAVEELKEVGPPPY